MRNLVRHRRGGFSLIELMTVVTILGLLAAVALPSYAKYVRRSRTSEASMNVRKMYDASVGYYGSEHADRNGSILPRQFPNIGTRVSTPGTTCCLAPGNVGGKCMPNPGLWDVPTWIALNFGEFDPWYYQYSYVSAGTDVAAQFTAAAYGDLDCDGLLSTFERAGAVGALDRTVHGGAGMYVNNEVE
jgi:prepilin-type N-terminal cleavage/methylation domain-containing protein